SQAQRGLRSGNADPPLASFSGAIHEKACAILYAKASQVISTNPDRRKSQLLQPYRNAIGPALGVDHGELEEATAGRRQLGLAPGGIRCDRHTVDEPGERQGAALGL